MRGCGRRALRDANAPPMPCLIFYHNLLPRSLALVLYYLRAGKRTREDSDSSDIEDGDGPSSASDVLPTNPLSGLFQPLGASRQCATLRTEVDGLDYSPACPLAIQIANWNVAGLQSSNSEKDHQARLARALRPSLSFSL